MLGMNKIWAEIWSPSPNYKNTVFLKFGYQLLSQKFEYYANMRN